MSSGETITLLIKDVLGYRGETRHEIGHGATLVTGPNASGKSGLAAVLAAVLAQDPNPLHIPVSRKGCYRNDHASSEGIASLGDVSWSPSRGTVTSPPGYAPVSPYAVGSLRFSEAGTTKDRAKAWQAFAGSCEPEALLKGRIPDKVLPSVIKTIESRGWEGAAAYFEDQRKDYKRAWSQHTGTAFGDKKAPTWRPDGWKIELDTASEDALQETLNVALQAHEAMVGIEAVEGHVIEEAKAARDVEMPAKEDAIARARAGRERHNVEVARRDKEVSAYQQAKVAATESLSGHRKVLDARADAKCPHCSKGLRLSGQGVVEKWALPTKAARDNAEKGLAQAQVALDEASKGLSDATALRNVAKEALQESATAIYGLEAELSHLRQRARLATARPKGQAEEVARHRSENVIAEARSDIDMWRVKRKADAALGNIVEHDHICQVLGPEGVRASLMDTYFAHVNSLMDKTCGVAGWPPVALTTEYALEVGGRPVALTAASERFRAQVVCQVVVAALTTSPWLVVDAADILRGDAWTGLVRLVDHMIGKRAAQGSSFRVVVCATETETPPGWTHITATP